MEQKKINEMNAFRINSEIALIQLGIFSTQEEFLSKYKSEFEILKKQKIQKIILDFDAVKTLDEPFIEILIEQANQFQKLGRHLALVRIPPKIEVVFKLIGIIVFFKKFASIVESFHFFCPPVHNKSIHASTEELLIEFNKLQRNGATKSERIEFLFPLEEIDFLAPHVISFLLEALKFSETQIKSLYLLSRFTSNAQVIIPQLIQALQEENTFGEVFGVLKNICLPTNTLLLKNFLDNSPTKLHSQLKELLKYLNLKENPRL